MWTLIVVMVAALSVSEATAAGPQVGVPWAQARELCRAKPLSFDTILARGDQPLAAIVAPDAPEWQDLARKLQGLVGTPLPIVPATTVVTGPLDAWTPEALKPLGQGGRHLILLGDLNSNPVVRRLYYQWQAFEDGAYPGAGGYAIRTVVDPEGLGWNAIILGGQSAADVAPALEPFANTLQRQEGSVVALYSLRVKWGGGPESAAADLKARAENVAAQISVWENFLRDPTSAEYKQFRPNHGAFDWAQDLLNIGLSYGALHYAMTGNPELAGLAGRAIDVLYQQMDWVEQNRTVSWDAHYSWETWTRAWQQVANCPLLTDEQRARGTALFGFFAGQMCMYQWPLDSYGKTTYRSLSRHEYAGIFGGDALCRQILKHVAVQPPLADVLVANRRNFGVVIDTMLQDYCDGFDHKWGLDANWTFFQAAVEEPRPQFVESGMARLCADYAMMVVNNSGEFVNYGSENVSPLEGYDAWQVLCRAEAIFRDGSYQWWINRWLKRPYKTFILGMNYFGHWYQPPPGAGQEPARFLGVNCLPLPRHVHEDLTAGRGRLFAGIPVVNDVPYENGFNKLTMRDGLQPDDQYLLLDGLGGITYSGNDAGAIAEYSRYGQRLLVQIEGKPDPFYQNFVSVSRGNAVEPTGTFARLTDVADLGPMIMARLEVEPLCGAKAARTLFMERGKYCLVFDDVTVKDEDEYVVTSNWRTPLQQMGTFDFAGDKADLHMEYIALPGLARPSWLTSQRTAGLSAEEAKFRINVLRETVARRFKAGEMYRFANLFQGQKKPEMRQHGTPPPSGFSSIAVSRSAALVERWSAANTREDEVVFGAAIGGKIECHDLTLAAAACRLSRTDAQLVRMTRIVQGKQVLVAFPTPVTLSLTLADKRIVVQSPDSKTLGAIQREPQWRAEGTWAEAAKGMALPSGGTLKMNATVLWAALQKAIRPPDAPDIQYPLGMDWPEMAGPARVWNPGETTINDTCLADLDGDGKQSLVAVTADGHVVAMDLQGKERFNVALGPEPLLSCWAGKLNGQTTVLAGGSNGALTALDATGKVLWKSRNTRLWYGPTPAVYSLTVGDFAGDGKDMIAVGTHGGGSLFDAQGNFVSFTQIYAHAMQPLHTVSLYGAKQQWVLGATWGQGLKLWQPAKQQIIDPWFSSWGHVAYEVRMIPVGDDLWFAYAGPHGVACARLSREAWAAGKRDASVWADAWYIRSDGETTALLPMDMNGDGTPELLTANETGFLVWYSLKGERLGKKLVDMQVQDMALRDTNRDGQPELVLVGENPQLLVLDRKLQPVGAGYSDYEPLDRITEVAGQLVIQSQYGVYLLKR
jgi:hypothetical protein